MAVDVLAASAGDASARALASPERCWTYGELRAEVGARAEELAERGLEAGRIVPLVLEPDADAVLALLATWRLGGVPAPLNPALTERERDAAVAALTTAPAHAHALLWTSGTSGRPRGVALSWGSFEASALGSAERLGLGSADVWLASLSPAHVGGLALIVRSLLLGACLVAVGRFEAAHTSELLEGRGLPEGVGPVTHLSLVPTQLLRIVEHRRGAPPPESLRCVLLGGAHAPAELLARAQRAGWPLATTYGATEMCSQVATAPPDLARRKPGTVGRPLPGVELRLARDGEILLRGATRALAYVGADDGEPLADGEGWYRTGDLGRLDEDGDLWITGRRADRIVSGGVTVDAVEVEEALRRHPAVIDACVVGIADAEWGERVGAWVVPVAGAFEPESVARYLRGHLSAAKLPRVWHLGGALPRNANGKVDRERVRAVVGGAR